MDDYLADLLTLVLKFYLLALLLLPEGRYHPGYVHLPIPFSITQPSSTFHPRGFLFSTDHSGNGHGFRQKVILSLPRLNFMQSYSFSLKT